MSMSVRAKVFKAPEHVTVEGRSIFLAGSIEMGSVEDWQTLLAAKLSHLPITIMNPRRDAWDGSWEQDISNPMFKQQVDWELDSQDRADVIAMDFTAGGNVQIICDRFGVELVDTMEQLTERVIKKLKE
ncbi:hypothetical protein C8F04DRAFT_1149825 [Mycena alexandri]|uniref:Uncharacterized protein n=1 Tax=Mycena alexandri TaxID=1745969 RepID=A0AAD6WPG7_9AGAR|nr:hypothetical protein C8F04DRAFT_1149825 [Mycena alexandri]